jgi:hypothetical protein
MLMAVCTPRRSVRLIDNCCLGALSVNQFLDGLRKYFEDNEPGEPATWTFGGLERQQDGRFTDSELVRLISDGCDNVAGKRSYRWFSITLTLPGTFPR